MVQLANSQQHSNAAAGPHGVSQHVTELTLRSENRQFANTGGLSKNNACHNFLPAFRNEETGEVALAKFADGRQAPMHIILGLPDSWATARNARGQVSAIAGCVIAGFVRAGEFYTRAEAAASAAAE